MTSCYIGSMSDDKRNALRILEGIENGTMDAGDSAALIEKTDPALVYLILTWVRRKYAGHVNADTVVGRLVEINNRFPAVAERMKEGQADSIVEWFEESYSYRELEPTGLVDIIVDKLES